MRLAWGPRSLRARLTLWYAASLAVVMLAYGGFVYLSLRQTLSTELDAQLAEDIEAAEGMVEAEQGGTLRLHPRQPHEQAGGEPPGPSVEILGPDGGLLFRSAGFSRVAGMRSLERTCAVGGRSLRITASRSEHLLRRELGELLLVLGLGLPIGLGIASGGGYLLARRALQPVANMAERARAITADRLSDRLPVEDPRDELGNLASVFNATFGRLEASFDQLRQFTADASHELRTPLTAMRAVGEVALREPRSDQEHREVIGSMLEEVDRLTQLVENLLSLARMDLDPSQEPRAVLDLVEKAHETARLLKVLAEEKQQTLAVESTGHVRAKADEPMIRQALLNLVDNAIRHSPAGAKITIRLKERGGTCVVEVIDNGPGIAREHRARVFERFYRVDRSRSRRDGGAGLGLSIALRAVVASGGTLDVDSIVGEGSTFRITLPAVAGTTIGETR